MNADIFYIHPNNYHFSMFYKKKKQNCSGDLHPCIHQSITLDPLGGLQLPPDVHLQLFLALPRTDAPIFFLYYPLVLIM